MKDGNEYVETHDSQEGPRMDLRAAVNRVRQAVDMYGVDSLSERECSQAIRALNCIAVLVEDGFVLTLPVLTKGN